MGDSAKVMFKRLKWGFLPTRRVVDEDENGNFIDAESKEDAISSFAGSTSEKVSPSESKNSVSKEVAVNEVEFDEQKFEFRDEKDRPWWKFFDEYEYRVTPIQKTRDLGINGLLIWIPPRKRAYLEDRLVVDSLFLIVLLGQVPFAG
ncbi:hypothetical protein Cantr_06792 [Candida viswanathii]|uniref:Uncharacterized protein n=1 Tax=Candida viswanathii TaxID=5486 RepID=A0A367XWR9_9ASCO|nr:hypothetical protein Cantr_06792 [Candida viswanathii]